MKEPISQRKVTTITKAKTLLAVALIGLAIVLSTAAHAQEAITPAEARAIAKEAYIYGYPMVDNFRIQYAYFVDKQNREHKAPWNYILNIPRVFTPEDRAIQTPNSDTPYSMLGLDLRSEPIVLTVPPIEKDRYFSYIQNESPGKDNDANWLPAPKGPFSVIMRLYWPKDEAAEGKWSAPPLKQVT